MKSDTLNLDTFKTKLQDVLNPVCCIVADVCLDEMEGVNVLWGSVSKEGLDDTWWAVKLEVPACEDDLVNSISRRVKEYYIEKH